MMLKKLARKQLQSCSKYLTNAFRFCSASTNDLSSFKNTNDDVNTVQNVPLPSETRVVVCGGGVMGAAVAYHLAEMGWGQHTIVLEQGR